MRQGGGESKGKWLDVDMTQGPHTLEHAGTMLYMTVTSATKGQILALVEFLALCPVLRGRVTAAEISTWVLAVLSRGRKRPLFSCGRHPSPRTSQCTSQWALAGRATSPREKGRRLQAPGAQGAFMVCLP